MTLSFEENWWAVILGGSSGMGLAAAEKLASAGMNIFVVHRDLRSMTPRIEADFDRIRAHGVQFASRNGNAIAAKSRPGIMNEIVETLGEKGRVRLLLHSIAAGSLRPLDAESNGKDSGIAKLAEKLGVEADAVETAAGELFDDGCDAFGDLLAPASADGAKILDEESLALTVKAMGTSLLDWVHDLLGRGLFTDDARILGLTSEGTTIAWKGYAAVAAAKAAMEALSRAIALELAPRGLRCNIVQAGVTDTPALRVIPGSAQIKARARQRNPFHRLTTPADVANVIALLATDEAAWINGSLIRVDGGEAISGGT